MIIKTCHVCSIEKPLEDFKTTHPNGSKTTRRTCNDCKSKGLRKDHMNLEKFCPGCCKTKSNDHFYQNKDLTFFSYCKPCFLQYTKTRKMYKKKQDLIVVGSSLIKSIKNLINKIEGQRGWVDTIDIMKLVHLRTEALGVKFYKNVTVENEMILIWGELKELVRKSDKKIKV